MPDEARHSSGEDDGLVAVDDDAVLDMPAHGARQHLTLEIAAETAQIEYFVTMRDTAGVLIDDRSLIERRGHVTCGCADQFDATHVGLLIRIGTDERRQKVVKHVDEDRKSKRLKSSH